MKYVIFLLLFLSIKSNAQEFRDEYHQCLTSQSSNTHGFISCTAEEIEFIKLEVQKEIDRNSVEYSEYSSFFNEILEQKVSYIKLKCSVYDIQKSQNGILMKNHCYLNEENKFRDFVFDFFESLEYQ